MEYQIKCKTNLGLHLKVFLDIHDIAFTEDLIKWNTVIEITSKHFLKQYNNYYYDNRERNAK